MQNPNQLGRPPSYSYAPPGQLGAPPPGHAGRSHSPMPPPINTATQPAGYPPQQIYGQGPPGYPQPGGGYGNAYQPPGPQGPQSYGRVGAASEMEGAGRSKAQLIVGIDFVSCDCRFVCKKGKG
jgi:hypothetical protein